MSEVFEGVILKQRPLDVGSINSAPELRVATLGDSMIIYRADSRTESRFSNVIDQLASSLADQVGVAVVVRYDSRIGHRSSVVYQRGHSPQCYELADELFVPLDDDGEPRTDVQPVRFDQRDKDEEYETSSNAIERGLAAIDRHPSWQDLRRFIASQ